MKTNVDLMWLAVAEKPKADTAKLALADAMRETGRILDARLAATIQWCVAKKRWPKLVSVGPVFPTDPWAWSSCGRRDIDTAFLSQGNGLPTWLSRKLECRYASAEAALKDLAKVLYMLHSNLPNFS